MADLEDKTGAVDNTEDFPLAVACVHSDTGGQGWRGGGGWTLDPQLKLQQTDNITES